MGTLYPERGINVFCTHGANLFSYGFQVCLAISPSMLDPSGAYV